MSRNMFDSCVWMLQKKSSGVYLICWHLIKSVLNLSSHWAEREKREKMETKYCNVVLNPQFSEIAWDCDELRGTKCVNEDGINNFKVWAVPVLQLIKHKMHGGYFSFKFPYIFCFFSNIKKEARRMAGPSVWSESYTLSSGSRLLLIERVCAGRRKRQEQQGSERPQGDESGECGRKREGERGGETLERKNIINYYLWGFFAQRTTKNLFLMWVLKFLSH